MNSPRVITVSIVFKISGSESLRGRVRSMAGIVCCVSSSDVSSSEKEMRFPDLSMASASGYVLIVDSISDWIIPQSWERKE